ncbi:MAG: hypothetical protein SGARI_007057 [Bacillariaceae sp.]
MPVTHCLDCPVEDLGSVEFRIGGVVTSCLDPREHNHSLYINVPQRDTRAQNSRAATISIGGKSVLFLNITGWQESDWRPMLRENDTWNPNIGAALAYFKALRNRDECRVVFRSIGFNVQKYTALLSEEQQQAYQGLDRKEAFVGARRDRFVAAGIPLAETIMLEALLPLLLDINRMNDEFEQVLPLLVEVFRLCTQETRRQRLEAAGRLFRKAMYDTVKMRTGCEGLVARLQATIHQKRRQMEEAV